MSPGDTGWDVFSLEYHVSGHIRTVFTNDCMLMYLRVFNFLWRAKRMEYILAMIWKEQMANAKLLRPLPGNTHLLRERITLRRARLVLGWVTLYGQVNHLSTKPAS